ncbi:Beta-Casp domain protein [uncultured archaeon]|nr:Beta-Casp domain protein [uncultured archaeon]
MKYQGYGGVDGKVAGSKHLFTIENGKGIEKILHDCGSNLEGNGNGNSNPLPFKCEELNAVVFSHGHYDHMGDLPKLHMQGYKGSYFGQEVTKEIAQMQLAETVNQEFRRSSEYNQTIKGRRDEIGEFIPFKKPHFVRSDVKSMMSNFQGMKYNIGVNITDNVKVTFYDAGHIIGSSQVLYEINENGKKTKILTCVDLGRSDVDSPILNYPHTKFPEDIDYCFIESTYGGRKHADKEKSRIELESVLLDGIKNQKRMLIGAFSIMRTHTILSDLYWIYKRGSFPKDFKIYLDSPGALKMNAIIKRHPECMDGQATVDFRSPKENPFSFPNLVTVKDSKMSYDIDSMKGPYAVISASGMWFMGKIVRHLKSHIEDEKSLLIQTGYQVPGKIGAFLEEGREKHPRINIEGQNFKYRAEQARIRSYGAHADGDDCVKHIMENVKPRKKVFIVHGEKEQSDWTKSKLESLGMNSEIVRLGKVYKL